MRNPQKKTKTSLELSTTIEPITNNQKLAFDSWYSGKNLVLHGTAGTGKTYIGLYFALKDLFETKEVNNIYIIRSSVSTRDVGFLPGNVDEKSEVYESPYISICSSLFNRGDAYQILKKKGYINFTLSSFLRGETFDDSILIVDEFQNMGDRELDTIMTRIGTNSKIILSGDVRQDDLTSERFMEYSGAKTLLNITDNMSEFDRIEFGIDDIVRSNLVRSYIISREKVLCRG